MMTPDTIAAILINDLDTTAHYIEALPAHPRYTDALVAVQAAKQALIDGRSDLHQSGMKERFGDGDGFADAVNATLAYAANEAVSNMSDRRVPRNASVQQPTTVLPPKLLSLEPWRVDYNYFKTFNVPAELESRFWSHHSDLSTGYYILRTHVESRDIPRVLHMCYSLDKGNDVWTLDIKRCPAELRKYYPSFPLSYTAKEWDEGNIRETWYKKLYYWMEDAGEYRLRHGAQAWHVEDGKHG